MQVLFKQLHLDLGGGRVLCFLVITLFVKLSLSCLWLGNEAAPNVTHHQVRNQFVLLYSIAYHLQCL